MINVNEDISKLSVNERLDRYREANALRLAMQHKTDEVKVFAAALETSLIADIPKSGEGIVSNGYLGRITSTPEPALKDWKEFIPVVVQYDRFDWLQKRLATKALKDTENWQAIPGLEVFNNLKLSVTKI